MATVHVARDLERGCRVAIKVLRPEIAAALGAERFLREIEVAARLTHPHILPLHDSGEAAGFLYYVMPYIESESLRDRLGRGGELPLQGGPRVTREGGRAPWLPPHPPRGAPGPKPGKKPPSGRGAGGGGT